MKYDIIDSPEESARLVERCRSIQANRKDDLGAAIWNASRVAVFGDAGIYLIETNRLSPSWDACPEREHRVDFNRLYDDVYIAKFPNLTGDKVWKCVHHNGSNRMVNSSTSIGFKETNTSLERDHISVLMNAIITHEELEPERCDYTSEPEYSTEVQLWIEGKKQLDNALKLSRNAQGKKDLLEKIKAISSAFQAGEIFRHLQIRSARKLSKRAEAMNPKRGGSKSRKNPTGIDKALEGAIEDYAAGAELSISSKPRDFLKWLDEPLNSSRRTRAELDYNLDVVRAKPKRSNLPGKFIELIWEEPIGTYQQLESRQFTRKYQEILRELVR